MSFSHKHLSNIPISGVKILEISQHNDTRGSLWTVWSNDYDCGKSSNFVLDKVAVSKYNVLRGMHGDQKSHKYICVLAGKVFFALCDYRPFLRGSESEELKCHCVELSSENPQAIYIPPGVLNGHYVLSDEAVFFYKWRFEGPYPDVEDQISVKWSDPRLKINWPCSSPILQARDQ
ncbi:dTDP-4-dehydrorhamnose 3,5-epimerase family protein [Pseudopelagicola sp. nBUS_20]|uniref:dTDP-4-dehydrorhamnose 3,5-epimerase family protein n=1 Tax=Pseudopelagicola sp. nBUS_20 TaxID=3395317 RepID=UPI003EBA873D